MAKDKYLLAELDARTREYLVKVRQTGGADMAGIFLSSGVNHAAWAFPLVGAGVVVGVLFYVVPPLNHPTHQAMLLTAGLLLGGWMLVAGIRMMIARVRGHNLGTFTYADPRQIWIVDNSVVTRWPLKSLQGFTATGTHLALEYPDGVEQVPVPFEIGIREIAAYVGHWLYVRGEGEHNQALIEAHAASARAMAYGQTPDEQPAFALEIPVPKPDPATLGRSRDWPILLAIVVGGIAMYFVVHSIVLVWHDDAVFTFVRSHGPVHWRAYLLDDRNTRHREEVQQMLHNAYRQRADHVKEQIRLKNRPPLNGSEDAMAQLLLALADAPQPIVTLRVLDETDDKNRAQFPMLNHGELQNKGQTEITDCIYSAVGQDLISLIEALEDVPALLDVRFKLGQGDTRYLLEWTLAVRKDPDSEPLFKMAWTSTFIEAREAEEKFVSDLNRIKIALSGEGP